jgi:hypothetical protein
MSTIQNQNQVQLQFAQAFNTFCTYFTNYRVDNLYRNVNGSHVGQFKRKKQYDILHEYANIELKIESFKCFLMKILVEISKLTINKRIFITQASLQLIKDFHEL